MALSNEEDRRFQDIIQGLAGINHTQSADELSRSKKARIFVIMVLVFIAGIFMLIFGVSSQMIIVGVVGFIAMLLSATRMSLLILSGNDELEE